MSHNRMAVVIATALLGAAANAPAQEAHFIFRLGRDTMAVEQFTRTASRLTGELLSRSGAAVQRLQYEVTIGRDGKATSAVLRQRNAAGAALPNTPTEVRLTFVGDSVKREAQFADSVNTRMIPAAGGTPAGNPGAGMLEIPFARMRKENLKTLEIAAINAGGGVGRQTLTAAGGDTIQSSSGLVFRVDRDGRILSVDATATTQKLVATRGSGRIDLNGLASAMRPAGVLSGRGNARASFLQSAVFIDYGRPQVRERTVWGGVLVPPDIVWRAGANEATHLATGRELTFGNVVVPPGLYTLFILIDRAGAPQLIINRQVGQWGTVYNAANDVGRVPMTMADAPQHVEEFTISIRNAGAPNRGAIDFAWGDKVATAQFTVRQQQ